MTVVKDKRWMKKEHGIINNNKNLIQMLRFGARVYESGQQLLNKIDSCPILRFPYTRFLVAKGNVKKVLYFRNHHVFQLHL